MEYKDFIVPTTLSNTNENQAPGGVEFNTEDLVYLDHMVDVALIDKSDRINYPTDYAVMNGAIIASKRAGSKNMRGCCTFLRSACFEGIVDGVGLYGELDRNSIGNDTATLRPALRLNLEDVIGAKGLSPDIFKITDYKEGGEVKYHTIEFG